MYDPTRAWTIPATQITLPNDNGHFLYLKVPTAEGATNSEFLVDEHHIDPLRDEGYIIYKQGYIQPKQNGKRTASMLWGNTKIPVPEIVSASELALGIIAIATTAEVTTGTDDARAVTPLKLKQALGTSVTLSSVRKFTSAIGDGSALSYLVTHNLNTRNTKCSVSRTLTPFDQVECEIINTSVNSTTFNFNVAPTEAQYTVTIMG